MPTHRRTRLRRHVLVLLGTALGALMAMCLLPYPEYYRYFEIIDESRPKPPWIYQRIHYDPTGIDVAFFGTSRTDGSVDSRIVARVLRKKLDRSLNVVNFALPRTGRNMQYLLARELLQNRKVKMIIFELGPLEDRIGHPQFVTLADPWEVLTAPILMNLRYVEDLARLPGREAYLFLRFLQTKAGLWPLPFEETGYHGSTFDRVDTIPGLSLEETMSRDVVKTKEELDAELAEYMEGVTPSLLPDSMSDWEWRMDRFYVRKTRNLAEESGAGFALTYLPFYSRYEMAEHVKKSYLGHIPVLDAPELVRTPDCWLDPDHLNAQCGRRYSEYVGNWVADLLVKSGKLEAPRTPQ